MESIRGCNCGSLHEHRNLATKESEIVVMAGSVDSAPNACDSPPLSDFSDSASSRSQQSHTKDNEDSNDVFQLDMNRNTLAAASPALAPSKEITLKPSYTLDKNGFPIPNTFADLVMLVREELGPHGLMDHGQFSLPRLTAIINNYTSKKHEWEKFAFFDKFRYTRNLVDDGNGRYNLLLLCWGKGHQSPIHDHAGSHCILKVMQGSLVETRYPWPKNSAECECSKMQPTSADELSENETGYMHDEIGLHRVSNPSEEIDAVSLHLYSPPIQICQTFNEQNGQARQSGNCVFFSVRGERNNVSSAGLIGCSGPK
jgi:cysteine dioxygenase